MIPRRAPERTTRGDPRPARSERGSGLLSTTFGVLAFMVGLLVSAQMLIGLWARTTADALVWEAAREVARSRPGDESATAARAEADLRSGLGAAGGSATIRFSVQVDRVTVEVHPGESGVGGRWWPGARTRRATVAREHQR